jgi:hypothetical protein
MLDHNRALRLQPVDDGVGERGAWVHQQSDPVGVCMISSGCRQAESGSARRRRWPPPTPGRRPAANCHSRRSTAPASRRTTPPRRCRPLVDGQAGSNPLQMEAWPDAGPVEQDGADLLHEAQGNGAAIRPDASTSTGVEHLLAVGPVASASSHSRPWSIAVAPGRARGVVGPIDDGHGALISPTRCPTGRAPQWGAGGVGGVAPSADRLPREGSTRLVAYRLAIAADFFGCVHGTWPPGRGLPLRR